MSFYLALKCQFNVNLQCLLSVDFLSLFFLLNTWFSTSQDSHRFGTQISKALKDIIRILSADTKTSSSPKGTTESQSKKLL